MKASLTASSVKDVGPVVRSASASAVVYRILNLPLEAGARLRDAAHLRCLDRNAQFDAFDIVGLEDMTAPQLTGSLDGRMRTVTARDLALVGVFLARVVQPLVGQELRFEWEAFLLDDLLGMVLKLDQFRRKGEKSGRGRIVDGHLSPRKVSDADC
jgi:hypothetical protein